MRSGKLAGDYEAYSNDEGGFGEGEVDEEGVAGLNADGLPSDAGGYGGGGYGGRASSSGRGGGGGGGRRDRKLTSTRSKRGGEAPPGNLVPHHLRLHVSSEPSTTGQDGTVGGGTSGTALVDLLHGQYVSYLGPTPPDLQLAQIQELVKRSGGNYSMNLVRDGPRSTSFLLADDTCRETEMHRRTPGSLDCLTLQWLKDGVANGQLRIPPRPRDYVLMSIKSRLGAPDHHDVHGRPYQMDMEASDLRAIIDRHFDRGIYDKTCRMRSRRLLTDTSGLRMNEEGEEEEEEEEEPMEEAAWRRSLREGVRKEMQAFGIEPLDNGFFDGLILFTLPLSSSPSDLLTKANDNTSGLLKGCSEASELARKWKSEAEEFASRSRSITVRSQGGVILDQLDASRVTHIVLPSRSSLSSSSSAQAKEVEILFSLFEACKSSIVKPFAGAGGKDASLSDRSSTRARRRMAVLKSRLLEGNVIFVSSSWIEEKLKSIENGSLRPHTDYIASHFSLDHPPNLWDWTNFLPPPGADDEASSEGEELKPEEGEEEEDENRTVKRRKKGEGGGSKTKRAKSSKKGKGGQWVGRTKGSSKKKSSSRKRPREEEQCEEVEEVEEVEDPAMDQELEQVDEIDQMEKEEEMGEMLVDKEKMAPASIATREDERAGALVTQVQSRSLALLDMLNDMTRR